MNQRFLPDRQGGTEVAPVGGYSQELEPYERGYEDPAPPRGGLGVFLQILIRWRWLFLAIVAATLAATTVWTVLQTPLYRATATMELNPAPVRVVQTTDTEEPRQSDRDYLALQIGLVKSRSVAERVARSLNLGRDERFLGHVAAPNAGPDAAVGQLMDGFSAAGTASDRIMRISFVHSDPAIAARVVNAFGEQAIESTFERSTAATARSRAFLQQRLEATRRELERSERELIQYARQANIVNLVTEKGAQSGDSAGGTLVASNLVALNEQLADAQNARIVAQQRYAQAEASANSAAAVDGTAQALRQQRAQLQGEYDQKLERFLPGYPEMVSIRQRIESLDREIANATGRTSSAVTGTLRADYVAAQNRERALQARINELQSRLLDLNDRGVQYTILRRAVDAHRTMYNSLLARLGEESSSATRTSSIALVDQAEIPGAPFSPNIPRTLLLGLLGGLVLGSAGAIGAERMYDTINLPEDVRDRLRLPVLGVIPIVPPGQQVDEVIANSRSPVSEAYHSVRAALQFLSPRGAHRSILFTSPRAEEGKTTSTIAIASDFISIGKRVVVIDADLRKPSLRGADPTMGLSTVLTGAHGVEEALTHTETQGLVLLSAGPTPPDPTVLLASNQMVELVRDLERRFDIVLIDGPPVLGLADAPLLSSIAEATVMIFASGQTRRSVALNAIERLAAAGAVVVGAILTKFDARTYGYGYGYGGYSYEYEYSGTSRQRALIGPSTSPPVEE
jgi:capsular exopolysaccharide synthesis family protein